MANPKQIHDKAEIIEKIIELRISGYQAAKIPPVDSWHLVERALSGSSSEDSRQTILAKAKKIKNSLKQKPLEEINEIYEEESKRAAEETRQKENREREKLKREFEEEEKKKIWNRPASKARYDYWCKMPYWSISEGIILLLGYDPRVVTDEDLTRFYGVFKFPVQKRYEETYELARRSLKCGQLSRDNAPNNFIQWAKKCSLPVASELEMLVNSQTGDLESNPATHEVPLSASSAVDTLHEQSIDERDEELQLAMNNLAIEYRQKGKTYTKESLAHALSKRPEYKGLKYETICRITRKPKIPT